MLYCVVSVGNLYVLHSHVSLTTARIYLLLLTYFVCCHVATTSYSMLNNRLKEEVQVERVALKSELDLERDRYLTLVKTESGELHDFHWIHVI